MKNIYVIIKDDKSLIFYDGEEILNPMEILDDLCDDRVLIKKEISIKKLKSKNKIFSNIKNIEYKVVIRGL